MEKRNLSELSLEELVNVAGGTIEPINERSMDLLIRLFKQQGRKMVMHRQIIRDYFLSEGIERWKGATAYGNVVR